MTKIYFVNELNKEKTSYEIIKVCTTKDEAVNYIQRHQKMVKVAWSVDPVPSLMLEEL